MAKTVPTNLIAYDVEQFSFKQSGFVLIPCGSHFCCNIFV